MRVGALYLGNGRCRFRVWAPFLKELEVRIVSPGERNIAMEKEGNGFWIAEGGDILPGTQYFFRLHGDTERPDPASCLQAGSVHGPSVVVDHSAFQWDDDTWSGVPLERMTMYELHIGIFTPEGNFDAVERRLDELFDLGINTVEIMPVAQFPGERNWGYDGVYPFSVQNSYGGPEGLKKLVGACHRRNMAVILDVVYNHLGPEGNYLRDFGPYFTERYNTPWGAAVNFDDAYNYGVRNFFIENALHWFRNYHMDALRLDAVHAIYDMSARPFLQELADKVRHFSRAQGKKFTLIAESDLNDAKITRTKEIGGYGIDSQWCDDFHHAVHALLTGERKGYYVDFGRISQLAKSVREGFVYSGQFSEYRKKHYGNSSKDRPGEQFVFFSQNHDQVGNRMLGERLPALVSFEALKLAAGIVILPPAVPLLFMGEEYGEDAPFLYFVSHSDDDLIDAVRKGRKREFSSFVWQGDPPDPQSEKTFLRSKLDWEKQKKGRGRILRGFYRELFTLRKEIPALAFPDKDNLDVYGFGHNRVLFMRRWQDESQTVSLFNFGKEDTKCTPVLPEGKWRKLIDSSATKWDGPGGLLPEIVAGGEDMLMRGESFMVFIMETGR
jgi:maltooligosyltrehalose trehalohydrolase